MFDEMFYLHVVSLHSQSHGDGLPSSLFRILHRPQEPSIFTAGITILSKVSVFRGTLWAVINHAVL